MILKDFDGGTVTQRLDCRIEAKIDEHISSKWAQSKQMGQKRKTKSQSKANEGAKKVRIEVFAKLAHMPINTNLE